MPNELTLIKLKEAVTGSAAAFRCRRRLQPAGGPGEKVFPPTYAGATYAVELRRVPGHAEPVTCVLLDSVQSQANRMELALHEARAKLSLPVIEVDFTPFDPTGDPNADKKNGRLLDAVGKLTSLQVPHRLADAILRDSEFNGVRFRQSQFGREINTANPLNATGIYKYCPTALVFGMWDSTGPKGGLGAKFERAMVSEVIGVNASFGLRTGSRIDPLIRATAGITLYQSKEGGWTLDKAKAALNAEKKPILLGKKGKVSEANLGNVTPSFSKYGKNPEGFDPMRAGKVSIDYSIRAGDDDFSIRNFTTGEARPAKQGEIAPGGVTIEFAEQITTLSLISLRRLCFPVTDLKAGAEEVNRAARTVLAALGLCAAALAFEPGMGLRSRCLLWPEEVMEWELLDKPGSSPARYALTGGGAEELLNGAIKTAEDVGLKWQKQPVQLKPSKELVDLVRKSQEQAVKEISDATEE